MIVVEIGSGDKPGPYYGGAKRHCTVDINPSRDTQAELEAGFLPIWGDARKLDGFGDATTDVVLTRNLYGDPSFSFDDLEHARELMELAIKAMDPRKNYLVPYIENCARVWSLPGRIQAVQEALRILRPAGQLVVVEQYTPQYAEALLPDMAQGVSEAIGSTLKFEEVDLAEVAPNNYATAHAGAHAWVMSKPLPITD